MHQSNIVLPSFPPHPFLNKASEQGKEISSGLFGGELIDVTASQSKEIYEKRRCSSDSNPSLQVTV